MPWLVARAARSALRLRSSTSPASAYALADGRIVYTLIVGEKTTMPVRVIVRGVAGHASVPTLGDNALLKLAPVLERLAAYEPVRRPSPELDAAARRRRAGRRAPWRSASSAAAHSTRSSGTRCRRSRARRSCRRWPRASRKRNVIPAEAEVEYDCRVLPGTEPEELLGEFRAALGDLDVEAGAARAAAGRHALAVRHAAQRRARRVGRASSSRARCSCRTSAPGFTDSHFLREAFGTIAYGFFPLRHTAPELLDTAHAPDERIDVRDLELAVRAFVHCIDRIGSVTT